MTRKFSLDLEDLYTDTDRVTSVTVYHDDDIIDDIVDSREKSWKLEQLSERDRARLEVSLIEELIAQRERGS